MIVQVPREQASNSSSEAPAVHSSLTCIRASAWGVAWFEPNGAGSASRLFELCAPAWIGRCVAPCLSLGPGIVPFHPPGPSRVPLFFLASRVRGGRPPPARVWVVSADRSVPVAARLCRGPGRAPGPLGGRYPPLRCAAVLLAAVCPICLVAAWQVTRAAAMAAAAFVAARNWVMSPASAATFVAAAAATRAAAAASAAAALAAAAVPRSLPISSPLR